jgi:putative transcriptional regulator
MISHHPNDATLVGFVEGVLPRVSSLLVSAHCDMCVRCRNKTESFTDTIASNTFEQTETGCTIPSSYHNMLESIINDISPVESCYSTQDAHKLVLDGKTFTLPSTLARFSDRVGEWSHLVGKLWQAPVEIGGTSLAHLIYMEKGGSVPEHTHKGNEITLVINGEFADGNSKFHTGDFISLNQNDTHTPVSNADEGCLVLTVLDKPLHFTSGWAKFINPLSQLYFNVNTK